MDVIAGHNRGRVGDMPKAIIQIGGEPYTFENWKWTGPNKLFVDLWNAQLDPDGPAGDDPYPTATEAERVAEQWGGEVVYIDKNVVPKGKVVL